MRMFSERKISTLVTKGANDMRGEDRGLVILDKQRIYKESLRKTLLREKRQQVVELLTKR